MPLPHAARFHRDRPIDFARHLLLLLLLTFMAAPAYAAQEQADDWQVVDDHWYILEMAGSPAGWSNDVVEKRGDLIRTINRSMMKMKRAAIEIESESSSVFIETVDGRPVSYESQSKTGQDVVHMLYTFEDGRVLMAGTQGDRRVDNQMPLPKGDWLTPYAAQEYFEARRQAGAATIEMRVLMPSQGLEPIGIKSVYQNDQMYEHDGRSLPVTHWKSEMTSMPGVETTDLLSADGHLVYQSVTIGLGELVTRVAENKQQAIAAIAGPAPEMMLTTFITPSRDLERFLETKTATFEVRATNGKLPDLPTVGSQTFERIDDGSAKIVVDLSRGSDASADKDDPANTGTSVMIDPEDKLIAALARRAQRSADDGPMALAEAMRKAAYQHISRKGYETAFASASETAKTRTGDCSEHAVLLAAMLRSQDIPARVATGLVFVPDLDNGRGIFGWHMWTQAMIDDAWVDLDATLPGDATHHAGHITTATATLADGGSESQMNSLMLMIGNLQIDVLEYGY